MDCSNCSNCKWCQCKETDWYDDVYYVCENRNSIYFHNSINYKFKCDKYENV